MNGCRYEYPDRKCYHPNVQKEEGYDDWCVEGMCHLKEPELPIEIDTMLYAMRGDKVEGRILWGIEGKPVVKINSHGFFLRIRQGRV